MNEQVYEKAVKLLTIRMHTAGELQRKLVDRGFNKEDILLVLQKLEELKFLDDRRFAEIFVDNLKRFKDFGYYGIRAKLAARQVPGAIAAAVLTELFTIEDEMRVAERLIGKLKKQGKTEYAKLARALSSRGFGSDVIQKILT